MTLLCVSMAIGLSGAGVAIGVGHIAFLAYTCFM